MPNRGLGRDQVHDAAWSESYPHPLASCLMPLTAVLALVVVGIFALQYWQWQLPREITIPDVEGKTQEEATTELRRMGLQVEAADIAKPSETIAEGSVAETDPVAGRRVKQGRLVKLVLSSGSTFSVVPDVTSLSQAEAHARLLKAGLKVATEEYNYDDTIPYDRVIKVTPAPGTKVKRASAVGIVLSEGQKPDAGDGNSDSSAIQRDTTVTVILPTDVPGPSDFRIDVTDATGKHVGDTSTEDPGKEITRNVTGYGKMTVEVYYADRLILTRKL